MNAIFFFVFRNPCCCGCRESEKKQTDGMAPCRPSALPGCDTTLTSAQMGDSLFRQSDFLFRCKERLFAGIGGNTDDHLIKQL